MKLGTWLSPPSLVLLVWLGFALAIVPLLVAVFSARIALEQLTDYSQITIYQAVRSTQDTRALSEVLTNMERNFKQFVILDDMTLYQAFEEKHNRFVLLTEALYKQTKDEAMKTSVGQLSSREAALYTQLTTLDKSKEDKQRIASAYGNLNRQATDIWQASATLVSHEVDKLDRRAHTVQKRIVQQSAILLPVSIVLGLISMYLIVRPVRQLDKAIRGLGNGNYDQPIRVAGTQDLEYLGERLDWLRQHLKSLEEQKETFLRNVSHELKTPLATVHEGAGLLVDEVVGELNQEQQDIARILLESSTRLDELISNLIKHSQHESEQSELRREVINLRPIIQSVVNEHKIPLRANHIKLKGRLESVKIFAVADKMRTIIDNLLSNAIKYSPSGGTIVVSLKRVGRYAQIEVEDDGPGIDPAERTQVFESFFQGRACREAKVRGSGLGLAIVHGLVVEYGGAIVALDPKPSRKGAYFRVKIPVGSIKY